MWETFKSNPVYWGLFNSLIVVAIVLVARFLATRSLIKTATISSDTRRRWLVQIRNASFFFILLGLLIVWGSELKTFAVSLVAIAAAIVIATKELILCFLGGILKTSTREFEIGHRIEVGAIRGDVISHSLMTTTLYEIGPGKDHHQFTGRMITLPNSLLLNTPVINESITGKHVLHVFKVSISRTDDWESACDLLTRISEAECQSYFADAKEEFEKNAKRQIMEAPTIEPRVHLSFPTRDQTDLVVRVPTPANRKGRIEQSILKQFAAAWKPGV
jgi:small-conductance mechanosensitive channel